MEKPLKILITNSGRRWIGEVGHCVLLYHALEALGHEVWIACRAGSKLEEHVRTNGLRHIVCRFWSRLAFSDRRDIRDLKELILREGIDVVHAHRGKDHWLATFAARAAGVPILRTRHVVTPVHRHPPNWWIYTRGTDGVLSVSTAAAESLGSFAEQAPLHRVILSAVNQQTFRPDLRSDSWRGEKVVPGSEPFWIGLIGRMQGIKGQKYFLDAAAQVAKAVPNAHFLLAGRGGLKRRERFEAFASRAGFADRIRIEGHLDNLPEVMASLDIGVIASIGSEGSSRVALEYMASGVPIVATTVGGIPELLGGEGAEGPKESPPPDGILVPPKDSQALADAMIALAGDAERRADLARRGLERVRAKHCPEDWAQAIVDFYREAIASK